MMYYGDIQRTVRKIPRGKVATYGDVARAAGYPGTARQVAWALRGAGEKAVPWQRVLGSGGRILLPGEAGFLQRTLLELEGVQFKGELVDMKKCSFRFRLADRRLRISNRARNSSIRNPQSKISRATIERK